MSYEMPFPEIINKSPLNHSPSKMMYSFPKTSRFNYGYGKDSSKTFLYDLPEIQNKTKGASIGYGHKSDFTKVPDIHKAAFHEYKDGFDFKKSGQPAFSFGVSRHFFDKVVLDNKGIPEKENPGPGRYDTQKSFGDEAPKATISPGKGERSPIIQITPGPGDYGNLDMSMFKKSPISSLRNTVGNLWGSSGTRRFTEQYKNISPGPGRYHTRSLIDGTGNTFFSNFKSTVAVSISGKHKDLKDKYPTPGPGAYNISFTEFGGINNFNYNHTHMKTKSYDSRAIKTYSDSIRKMTYNTHNNTNENFNYQTTGNKYDYSDFNKITEEDKKSLYKEKDGEVSEIKKQSSSDIISMLNEKVKEINNKNDNDIKQNLDDMGNYYSKKQTNNNLERFKNLSQSVKSSFKKNSETNRSFANNSKLLLDKKILNSFKSLKSNSNSNSVNNFNGVKNKYIYQDKNFEEGSNNLENSLNDYSKNLILLSPNKKNINFDKVNLSYLNFNSNGNNELIASLMNK